MFCDLVGSTQLSQNLDLEDVQKLLDRIEGSAARRLGVMEVRSLAISGMA